MLKIIKLLFSAAADLLIRFLPNFHKKDYKFAFLVHPRNTEDTYRKYPFFKYFPEKFLHVFLRFFWPVVLSEVEGLRSQKSKAPVKGYVITIPLTTRQMLEDRFLTLEKIVKATKLAEKKGVKIMGLGALTSSLTKGGTDLVGKTGVAITTGHAYTAYTVTANLFKLTELLGIDKKKSVVAIVGAKGSVGSTSAKVIARAGYNDIILMDMERKIDSLKDLATELKVLNKDVDIEISKQIRDIKRADFVITATNAPEAVVRLEDLKSGAIVIDDAQPSDVSPDVLEREDVLVVEGGIIHTPGIKNHFNFGLKDKFDNFCCMCEVMILASEKFEKDYVIDKASLELVDEISEKGKELDFRLADFQNFKEVISREKLDFIKDIINKK